MSTQDNANLLEELNSGFKITINRNKYQSKISIERQNQYLGYLIDPNFQWITRPFVLLFVDEAQRTSYERYCFPTIEIKNYNVIIAEQNFFDQPVRNNLRTFKNIWQSSKKSNRLKRWIYNWVFAGV